MQRTQLEDVEWWIEQVAKRENFDGPGFMRPYHFALLASEVYRFGAKTLVIPTNLEGYAARMRLWQAIGLEPPKTVNERNPGGRFHPLTPITSERDAEEAADQIRDVFQTAGTKDERTLSTIGTVLSEILGNCFFHSEMGGGIRGLACAQSWPAAKLAQVAVADIGVGIRRSLGGNPAHADRLAKENAIALATELGVTGKPAGQHSGYGLTVARQLMEKHDGNFVVLSGDEAFCATSQGNRAQKLLHPWAGTIVIIEWNTSRALDVAAVYGGWPRDPEDEFF